MTIDLYSHEVEEQDDDYIDMEVNSFTTTSFCNLKSSPQQFEFQMSSATATDPPPSTVSPADELFYKGKLLPLHLPPRLQMVQKLLQDSPRAKPAMQTESYATPLTTAGTTPAGGATPFESCNVSPVESCQVSRELNPDEYFSSFNGANPKKSWTKKLKIKIKSLFTKSGRSDEPKLITKKIPFGQITPVDFVTENSKVDEEDHEGKKSKIRHRRSFSGAFKQRSLTMKSSSSSSSSSSGSSSCSSSSLSSSSSSSNSNDLQRLKRSSSVKSEIESSLIQGAINHCKQSLQQHVIRSRKTLSEVGLYSLPDSRVWSG